MFEQNNRITQSTKPETFVPLGTGNYYYQYDIQYQKVKKHLVEEDKDVEELEYSFLQLRIAGVPEYKACVEAVIRSYLTETQEFDLINSANKDILAGKKNSDDITKYLEYLALLDEIKEKVKKDFA